MKRMLRSALVGVTAAVLFASCGGGTPSSPTPGGNNNGGVVTPPNTAPVVKAIAASETRIEVGTPVTLTATVEDAETPIDNLTFSWTFPAGTTNATGNGRVIAWTPSADLKTPGDFDISVTVTERYTANGVQAENKATSAMTLHVNNSPKELAEMSLKFLGDFANSKLSADQCLGDFSETTPTCARGKKDERDDIIDNRHDFEIVASTLRHTGLTISADKLSATVHTFCSFTSKVISPNPVDESCANGACPLGSIQGPNQGDCFTTNVYEKGRWWICESHYKPLNGILSTYERAFFSISGGG